MASVDMLVPIRPLNEFGLSPEATCVFQSENAGGSSVVSEALSVEYLIRRYGASDFVGEMEVQYWNESWKKVDYVCTLRGQRTGVSVTRAMGYPDISEFSLDDARRLLRKKLHGLVVARDGVDDEWQYHRSILHIWCASRKAAALVLVAYEENDRALLRELMVELEVVVLCTVLEPLSEGDTVAKNLQLQLFLEREVPTLSIGG
eukprot:Rmarinus@m.4321